MRRFAARNLLIALAVLVTVGVVRAADTTPVELNVILPLTGQAAFSGASEQHGLRAAESVVNAHGGIGGRPLKLIFNDDGSNAQTALQLANQLIAKNVQVFLGPALATECNPVFPIVEDNGPVIWCFSPVARIPKPGGYAFLTGPATADQQPFFLRYFKNRGYRRIGTLISTDASGQAFDDALEKTFALPDLHDLLVVAREHFNVADMSVSAQLARIKAAKPDIVLAYATGTPFPTMMRAINDAGLDVPIYTSGGNMIPGLLKQLNTILPKNLYFNGARGLVPDPTATGRMRQAQDDYFAALKKEGVPSDYSLLGVYDPAMIIADALRKVGPDASAAKLHEYLTHLKGWVGIEGTYDLTGGNQRGVSTDANALFRWNPATQELEQVAPVRGRR